MTHQHAELVRNKLHDLKSHIKPKKKKDHGQYDLGLLDLLPEDIKKELKK